MMQNVRLLVVFENIWKIKFLTVGMDNSTVLFFYFGITLNDEGRLRYNTDRIDFSDPPFSSLKNFSQHFLLRSWLDLK